MRKGFLIAVLGMSVAFAPAAFAQQDLTGETCLSGTAELDVDGDGTADFTYCLMQGRLGANEALQMDDDDDGTPVAGDAATVADANLFSNPGDPNLPFVPGATYIDWNDIAGISTVTEALYGSVENNRILDFVSNNDFTMLRPQARSCLNDGSVLPKEDFTQTYVANNDEFLYFAQERRTNNGNSVYYYLFTEAPPIVVTGGECGDNTRGQVQAKLTPGDVELLVNFPDSSDPAGGGIFFRRYEGAVATAYVPIGDAVFEAGWGSLQQAPILNFALNINLEGDTDDGYGYWGAVDKQGNPDTTGSYDTALFAEWALDLDEFFQGGQICGERLFLTGLSRASTGQIGDLTEPSALKDIVGPKLYSFGEITATATVTGDCELGFDYSVTAVGIDGVTPIPEEDLSCVWSCVSADGRTVNYDPNVCSGSGTIEPGGAPDTVTCTVDVTDVGSGCVDTDDDDDAVLTPISVAISANPTTLTCSVPGTPGFDNGNIAPGTTFTAVVSGGSGSYSYTWNVDPAGVSSCGNAATCVVDIPDNQYCALVELGVTVDDGSPLCPPADSNPGYVTKTTDVLASP